MQFVVDDPPAAEDDITLANTIPSYIQDAKTMLRERMECNNGTFKEHGDVFNGDDGFHSPSVLSFVRVHSTYNELDNYTPKVPSSVHIVTESSNFGIYVIDSDLNILRVSAGVVHGDLSDLDKDNCHSQYLLVDGSRSMSGSPKLTEVSNLTHSTTYDSDDKPMESSHTSENFHTAHGDGSISSRLVTGSANINKANSLYQGQDVGSDLTISNYSTNMLRYFPFHLYSNDWTVLGDSNAMNRSKTGDEGPEESGGDFSATINCNQRAFLRCTYKNGAKINVSEVEVKVVVDGLESCPDPSDLHHDFLIYKYDNTRTV